MIRKELMRLTATALITATAIGTFPCRAMAMEVPTSDLTASYIESDNAPVLMETTAYIHGDICSHGDKAREGIAAVAPEWYGSAAIIYEAVQGEDGYETGDFIGIFECLDTGYGYSTNDGIKSKVRDDKDSRGTIETGKHIDIYRDDKEGAKEWMQMAGGKVMVQIIRDVKG